MARRPARCLILSQDQVTELAEVIRECVAAWHGGRVVTARGIQIRKLAPDTALGNIADYIENSYRQQNGAKRYAEAWDGEQDARKTRLEQMRKLGQKGVDTA